MTFEEYWNYETNGNENNIIDWKGFCESAFEAGKRAGRAEALYDILKEIGSVKEDLKETLKGIKK